MGWHLRNISWIMRKWQFASARRFSFDSLHRLPKLSIVLRWWWLHQNHATPKVLPTLDACNKNVKDGRGTRRWWRDIRRGDQVVPRHVTIRARIHKSVKIIPSRAFYISPNKPTIQQGAFFMCTSLRNINMSSVRTITNFMRFLMCTELFDVVPYYAVKDLKHYNTIQGIPKLQRIEANRLAIKRQRDRQWCCRFVREDCPNLIRVDLVGGLDRTELPLFTYRKLEERNI